MRSLVLVVVFCVLPKGAVFSADLCACLSDWWRYCFPDSSYEVFESSHGVSRIEQNARKIVESESSGKKVYSPMHQGLSREENIASPVIEAEDSSSDDGNSIDSQGSVKGRNIQVKRPAIHNPIHEEQKESADKVKSNLVLTETPIVKNSDFVQEDESKLSSVFDGLGEKDKFDLVKEKFRTLDLFAEFTDEAVLNIHALESGKMVSLFRIYAVKASVMARACLAEGNEVIEHTYTRPNLLSFLRNVDFSSLEFMEETGPEVKGRTGSVASNAGNLPKPCRYDNDQNTQALKTLFEEADHQLDVQGYESFKAVLSEHIHSDFVRIIQEEKKQEILENLDALLDSPAKAFLVEIVIPRTREAENMSLLLKMCGVSFAVVGNKLKCGSVVVLDDKSFVKNWQSNPLETARLHLLTSTHAKMLLK